MTKLGALCVGLSLLAGCSATHQAEPARTPVEATPAAEPSESDEAAARLIARIDRAKQQWDDSCAHANAQGLCVEFIAEASGEARCAPPELGTVVVHPRDAALARAAQAELAEVIDLAGCDSVISCNREVLDVQPDDPALTREFQQALARARLVRADAKLEAYFALTLSPESSPDDWASAYEAKSRSSMVLANDLGLVRQNDDPEAILKAALRLTWAHMHMIDEIQATPIPASIRDDRPRRETYCEVIEPHAEVPRSAALTTANYCHQRANLSGSSSATAWACHALLEQLQR